MRYLAIGANGLIGLAFLVSALSKVRGRNAVREFVASVRNLRVLPAGLVSPAAALVIAAEFAVWLLLAVPHSAASVAGLAVAIGLLVPFAVGIGLAQSRGAHVACRCFGQPAATLGPWHVVRNVFLVIVAGIGLLAWMVPGHASTGGTLVSLCAGLLIGAVVTILDDIIDLFRPAHAGDARH